MKINNKKHKAIWGSVAGGKSDKSCLSHKLAKIAYRRNNGHSPEIDFFISIIVSGAVEKDAPYVYGEVFEQHCEWAGLDCFAVRTLITGLWDMIED